MPQTHNDYIVREYDDREYTRHGELDAAEHGFEISPAAAPSLILARFPISENPGEDVQARNAWLFVSALVEAANDSEVHAEAWNNGQRTVATVLRGNIWHPPTIQGPIARRLYGDPGEIWNQGSDATTTPEEAN